MPSRWLIPSEKVPTRLPATSLSPTMSRTSLTRRRSMPLLSASHLRWLAALRPPTMALASSSAPTDRSGSASWAYGLPLTRTSPELGASRPRIMRIVVDLPAPLGPRKPVTLPGWTTKETSSTATVLP